MAEYCENCNEKLNPNEEEHGICSKCKNGKEENDAYIKDENFVDPAVT